MEKIAPSCVKEALLLVNVTLEYSVNEAIQSFTIIMPPPPPACYYCKL